MKKYKTILILGLSLLGVTNNVKAQQKISGQILDSLTLKPIFFGLVKFSNTISISNADGEFLLMLSAQNLKDSITISSLGYQSIKYSIEDLLKDKTAKFYLSPGNIILNEVIVKPIVITQLLNVAAKTSTDKFAKPVILEGYYREVVKRDSFISKYADGMVNYYIEKDKNGKPDVTTQVKQSRVKETELAKDDEKYDGLNSKIDVALLPEFIEITKFGILDSNNFKNYSFKMTEIDGEKPIYKIDYKPLENINLPLTEGSIFIDKETNLILSVVNKFSPTATVKYLKSISLFGITANATAREIIVKYKIDGEKYYPYYISFSAKIVLTSTKFNQSNELKSEYLIIDYKDENVSKFSEDVFKKSYLFKNGNNFKTNFWETINSNPNNAEELIFLKK